MKRQKLLLEVTLTTLGMIGVLSLVTVEVVSWTELTASSSSKLSLEEIKLLSLVNPSIVFITAVLVGIALHKGTNVNLPLIEKILSKKNTIPIQADIIKYGLAFGILTGVSLSCIGHIFNLFFSVDFDKLNKSIVLSVPASLLYGGITEEIMFRFGLMTFIVWLMSKIFQTTNSFIYWIGILFTAAIFALGHLLITYQTIENPSASLPTYIMLGNSIGGIVFGWLYWKQGLESAFVAHICAHIIMLFAHTQYWQINSLNFIT